MYSYTQNFHQQSVALLYCTFLISTWIHYNTYYQHTAALQIFDNEHTDELHYYINSTGITPIHKLMRNALQYILYKIRDALQFFIRSGMHFNTLSDQGCTPILYQIRDALQYFIRSGMHSNTLSDHRCTLSADGYTLTLFCLSAHKISQKVFYSTPLQFYLESKACFVLNFFVKNTLVSKKLPR